MKASLKLSLSLLIAVSAMEMHAINGDFLINVKRRNVKEIRFSVNEIQKANVRIYDRYRNVLFSEVAYGKGGILKTYSLTEFPVGIYYLEVETKVKKVTHEIVVSKVASALCRRAVKEVYKRDLKLKNRNLGSFS